MDRETIVKVLMHEKACIMRQDTPQCDHRCDMCDLLLPTPVILNVYDYLINQYIEEDGDFCTD